MDDMLPQGCYTLLRVGTGRSHDEELLAKDIQKACEPPPSYLSCALLFVLNPGSSYGQAYGCRRLFSWWLRSLRTGFRRGGNYANPTALF